MSKEIDFSKAPEGATHYLIIDGNYKWFLVKSGIMYEQEGKRWSIYCGSPGYFPVAIPTQWTIYNNTKPLKDLSGEQCVEILNAATDHKNTLEVFCDGSWKKHYYSLLLNSELPYRIAREKSERELFVDECTKVMRKAGTKCPDNHEYFGALFDSGKFKLVKDGE